ncbi:MAG: amidohydrolase family protein [Clostridia bacterium]|nr:amidohydrolase family protein [Clostridia bacterium]
MIIDFHTHNFPDKIASSVIAKLEASGGTKASTDGTLDGLKRSMKKAGIDYSVVLPVITAPKQFDTVNRYAAETNGKDGIISFGGIHPDNDDVESKLDLIKELGLPGIKFHPDYQGVYIDDERYIRIIRYAVSIGLYVTTHAGFDPAYPDIIRCTPERALKMLDRVYDGKEPDEPRIILAHLGSLDETDKVIEMIAGKNLYLDTAVMLDRIPEEKILKLIRKHGADKILFATDCPWADQKKFVSIINSLDLTDSERSLITHKNAINILKKHNIAF